MATLAQLSGRPATRADVPLSGLLRDQVGHAAAALWRSRIVLVFTFVLPLIWLVMIGLVAGDEVVDPATGIRTMQYVTPMAAVLGLVFAAYPPVATALALAREQLILKRVRGTPLPGWTYLVAQVGAAGLLAAAALVVMLVLGVAAYGIEIQWHTALASIVTLGLGIACLASLGLAVGAVAPSASSAQAFTMASAVLMGFVSGLFRVGSQEPAWMAQVGGLFPMRNIADPLRDQFDPRTVGAGWDRGALAVLLAWAIGGLLVAAWALGREPRVAAATSPEAGPGATPRLVAAVGSLRAVAVARPTILRLAIDQAGWAMRVARRNPSTMFFGIVMPIGLYALVCSMYPAPTDQIHDMPIGVWFAGAMTAYGAGVIAFMHLPASLAAARERGTLKRLRGTPVPALAFIAGRVIEVVVLAAVIAILMLGVGSLAFGVRIAAEALPTAAAVLLLGTLSLAACGFALLALVPTARAVSVLTLAILLPLSFVSDIFVAGGIPEPVSAFASIFPLKHVVAALGAALNGGQPSWLDVTVVAAWMVVASVVAVRGFRWESAPGEAPAPGAVRRGRRRRGAHSPG